jgi:hypothetical protein
VDRNDRNTDASVDMFVFTDALVASNDIFTHHLTIIWYMIDHTRQHNAISPARILHQR